MLRDIIRSIPWLRGFQAAFRFIWKRIHIPLAPLVLVLMLEALSRSSFALTADWVLHYQNELAFNYWIALSLTLLAAGAAGKTRWTYGILFLLFGAAGFASGMKMNQTGAPLFIWDLVLPTSGTDTVRSLNHAVTGNLLWVAAAAAGITAGALALKQVRLGRRERTVYGAAALFLLGSIYLNTPIAFWDIFRIAPVRYEQEYNYSHNGFLVSVFDSLDFVMPERPEASGAGSIRKLVQQLAARNEADKASAAAGSGADAESEAARDALLSSAVASAGGTTSGMDSAPSSRGGTKEQPNVIVLLSESFWDPTLLKNVTFSEDPIPFFRSMMKGTTSGWMLSPQFGGTTANVEFEVLTGNSVRFLPSNSIAYINYVNRDVDSLASIYARQGYSTTAINPYFNWFFNSRNAYRNMGFSRFISSEFFEQRFHGPNYEDSQVMRKIIESIDDTPGPDFIFANTMENHGSYEDKFYDHPITVSGPISAKTKNMLENYATGEQAFDKAFKSLVEHYRETGEPTVILCFGDHLPAFGSSYYGYKDAGYITGGDDPDFMEKMHYTPFLIWDNTVGAERRELRMNASYLGAYLLHYMGKPGSYYTDFLYELYTRQPLIPIRPFRSSHPMDEALLADYKRLEYDVLFGRQTGYKTSGIAGRIAADAFTLGYGNPVLERAELAEGGRITVYGSRFTDECTVWLNGTKLRTSVSDSGKLTAWLPDGEPPAAPWQLEARITDLKHTVVARSNKLPLTRTP